MSGNMPGAMEREKSPISGSKENCPLPPPWKATYFTPFSNGVESRGGAPIPARKQRSLSGQSPLKWRNSSPRPDTFCNWRRSRPRAQVKLRAPLVIHRFSSVLVAVD